MTDIDVLRVMAGARRAAKTLCRSPTLLTWIDDVAGEIVLQVLEAHVRGWKSSRRMYGLFAFNALRSIYGPGAARPQYGFYPWERQIPLDNVPSPVVEQTHELFPIALWRLQAVWQTLDKFEQKALCDLILDDPHPIHIEMRQRILSHLNNPKHRKYNLRPINGVEPPSQIVHESRGKKRPWLVWVGGHKVGRFATCVEAIRAKQAALREAV
jgi:hypothetical protein